MRWWTCWTYLSIIFTSAAKKKNAQNIQEASIWEGHRKNALAYCLLPQCPSTSFQPLSKQERTTLLLEVVSQLHSPKTIFHTDLTKMCLHSEILLQPGLDVSSKCMAVCGKPHMCNNGRKSKRHKITHILGWNPSAPCDPPQCTKMSKTLEISLSWKYYCHI